MIDDGHMQILKSIAYLRFIHFDFDSDYTCLFFSIFFYQNVVAQDNLYNITKGENFDVITCLNQPVVYYVKRCNIQIKRYISSKKRD